MASANASTPSDAVFCSAAAGPTLAATAGAGAASGALVAVKKSIVVEGNKFTHFRQFLPAPSLDAHERVQIPEKHDVTIEVIVCFGTCHIGP